jgi:hypothetical protein
MPTGYTAPIYEGKDITFADYAMGCARAFGALMDLRDEPAGTPIPDEFIPRPYYREHLDSALRRAAEIEAWTDEQAEAEAGQSHDKAVRDATELRQQKQELRERYEAMLAQAEAWQPPTPEHEEYAKFMVSQLRESIEHDCYEVAMPDPVSGDVYKARELEAARQMAAYYEREMNAEAGRAHGRTEWLRALRGTLEAKADA